MSLITPLDLGSEIKERADFLANARETPLSSMVDDILKKLVMPQSSQETLETLHQFQRLYLVYALDMAGKIEMREAIEDSTNFPTWKNYIALQATEEQQDRLAYLMVNGDPQMRSPVVVTLSDYSRGVGEKTIEHLHARKDNADIWIDDPYFTRRILNHADEQRANALGEIMGRRWVNAKRSIGFRVNNASQTMIDPPASAALSKIYSDTALALKKQDPNQFYTITVLPTEKDAELDQIPYPEYVDLFFRMCAVDWNEIDAAHKVLIAKLNAGSILRITNDDGTDVSMDITGQTFANSRVAKNVPGSEVFSSPHKTSINGRVVAKGRFIPKSANELIEDIVLDIKEGKIVEYSAAVGQDVLASIIETDEGSHYFGEIGIGTNPVLQQHITNSLMVEKIGGSFHLAIGAAYEYTDYLGDPVILDNGNRSKIHWDITTMLVGKKGRMTLDDEVIMENGKWLDKKLAYLNAA